jgi:hypothetical protein
MEMTAVTAFERASVAPPGDRFAPVRTVSIAVAAVVAAVAMQAIWLPIDADVSWLITVSERVLAGDRLYLDIVEVNPPASVWLYLPLVWLAKLLAVRPEAVVVLGFAAAGLVSVYASVKLAKRLSEPPPPELVAAATSFAALLLPMALFAQREHAALLLALPTLCAVAVIAEGKRLSVPVLLASGAAAGLIVVIKPYFLPAVVAPVLWGIWARREIQPFLLPMVAGALVILAYAAAILLFVPAYLAWVPVIARTYAPVHDAPWRVLVGPAFFPAITIVLASLLRPKRIPSLTCTWGLGAAGFLLAALIQGKNYPNHWLPEAALALAAAAMVLPRPEIQKGRRTCIVTALAFVGLCEMYHWIILPDPLVAQAIREVAPPAPSIIALSPELTTGHPVTRNVDGRWVGSRAGVFLASGARHVGLGTSQVRAVYREDLRAFRIDVAKNSPDIILVSIPAKKWLMSELDVTAAMAGYRPARRTGDVEVWVRRSSSR